MSLEASRRRVKTLVSTMVGLAILAVEYTVADVMGLLGAGKSFDATRFTSSVPVFLAIYYSMYLVTLLRYRRLRAMGRVVDENVVLGDRCMISDMCSANPAIFGVLSVACVKCYIYVVPGFLVAYFACTYNLAIRLIDSF